MAFTAEMFEAFTRADQHRWGQAYVRGLLLDGRRKSVEPMAARLGEDGNRQALAHFVTSSPWDWAHVRARLAWRMHEAIDPTVLVVDDTGFLKDGVSSACVSRQYTGTAGKVTNCQVGVSAHLARDHASAPVNWRLFLPKSWDPVSDQADPVKVARRERRGIPADLGHVEKWQLALDTIDETRSWGVDVPLVLADAGYGDSVAFRLGLNQRSLNYVVGISTTPTAHRPPGVGPSGHAALQRHRPATGAEVPRPGPLGQSPGHRGRPEGGTPGAVARRVPSRHRTHRLQTHVLALRGPADPSRRTRDPRRHRGRRARRVLGAGRMARQRS